jgi:CDP-diglyceride synthetase
MFLLSGKEKLAPKPSAGMLLRGFAGGMLSIFILLLLSGYAHQPWIMAPFGASCVIAVRCAAIAFGSAAQFDFWARGVCGYRLMCCTVFSS